MTNAAAAGPAHAAAADAPEKAADPPAAPAVTTGQPTTPPPPSVTAFDGVYPNPIPGRATLAFSLAHDEPVTLAVYNVAGARVRSLASGALPAGRYAIPWDGRDDGGRALTGGVYFVRFSAGRYLRTLKTVMVK
ncbi:MAG: T9SS type A sorting domain-containing protein [Candidatus Eisenbacteria bacterium]|nr:T9SS type A sorting domain-containing protein [Candidatus Eisenbacteria bacterium]